MTKTPFYPLEDNYKKIEALLGKEFVTKSRNDTLTPEEFKEANCILSKSVYSPIIAKLIEERQLNKLHVIYQEILKTISLRNLSKDIEFDRLGAILVRPENMGCIEKYKEFLNELKLSIIFEKDLSITFREYLILYFEGMLEGLKHKDPLVDFPTRTFNYINNPCHLIIFTSSEALKLSEPVSDYILRFKGKHGRYTKNTLRGDIAYNSLIPFVTNPTSLVEKANVPLDPIGAYRMLTRGMIESDGWHDRVDTPILFYSGQAVHIPDSTEINKDLNTLCNDADLAEISKKLKR